MKTEHDTPHILSEKTCLLVWGGLMLLTAVTVGVAHMQFEFPFLHVLAAMIVATTKAGLVILWFMHMRYEGRTLRLMVFMAFLILAIFIGLIFFDTAYRYR